MKRQITLLLMAIIIHCGLYAGGPPPPVIEGPNAVVLSSSPAPSSGSFGLIVNSTYANQRGGLSNVNWGWTSGSPLFVSGNSLILDFNVPPLSFSGGSVVISARSDYNNGSSHLAEFICQVIKPFTPSANPGEEIPSAPVDDVLLFYPNPNDGRFSLMLNLNMESQVKIRVTDLSGKEVYASDEVGAMGAFQKSIELDKVKQGAYILKVNIGDSVISERIIID
ncbi:MAG: T9SS type A sorting domain-containing protein [Bacteroidota bacterium]